MTIKEKSEKNGEEMTIKEKSDVKKMTVKKIDEADYGEVIGLIKSEFPYVEFDEKKIRKRIERSCRLLNLCLGLNR